MLPSSTLSLLALLLVPTSRDVALPLVSADVEDTSVSEDAMSTLRDPFVPLTAAHVAEVCPDPVPACARWTDLRLSGVMKVGGRTLASLSRDSGRAALFVSAGDKLADAEVVAVDATLGTVTLRVPARTLRGTRDVVLGLP